MEEEAQTIEATWINDRLRGNEMLTTMIGMGRASAKMI